MIKRNERQGVLILLLVCGLAVSGCKQQEVEEKTTVARPVKLLTVGEDPVDRVFKYPGRVAAVKQSDMAFEVSGRIVEFTATEGEFVYAGTTLARLEPDNYQAQRDRARAEVSAAAIDFQRYQSAYQRHAVTTQQLDIARRNLRVAEAALKQAQKALDDTELVAPFDGRVAKKLVEDFANVQAKQTILILQSEEALEMKVYVPEAVWAKEEPAKSIEDIKLKGDISVEVSAIPGMEMPAIITSFTSMADPITRTFEVTLSFAMPKGVSISPGMTGRAIYREAPKSTSSIDLSIPANAVQSTASKTPIVWVVDQETHAVSQRAVTLGEAREDRIYILDGLQTGEVIAVSGVRALRDGDLVYPMKEYY
ncbi:efflux RND transporter periplasmic adaptor subunit [Vibrio hepatarius]|uniref:efflux RND transporter periplasmic adaptor subunit n=1 Tax=Vibrio hepatarius TaxID=171383 RepID=UPI00142DD24D|nr:efflux RND transporter periplasmic adaptor subunit [Vibrio hepatarius]NIY82030.1 efflux RND transporter periplasmic adaptor subunit [Vibrio hepatarius]